MSEETDTDLVADLLVKWEDAWDQGDDPTAEELCGDRTDLIEEVQKKIGSLKRSSWMKRDPAAFTQPSEPHPFLCQAVHRSVRETWSTQQVFRGSM